MDPAAVQEDRDTVTAFFRAQPLNFEGNRRTVLIDVWLHDMEQIFQLCHIEEHMQVRLATRCLYNEARLWWIETGRREVPGDTWMQFRSALRGRFGPPQPRGLGAPRRDPEIYRVTRHTQYELLSSAWHAYPGETMSHYQWRFREMMLPHVPQDFPEPELVAQKLLWRGVPEHIRQYVPAPTQTGDLISLIDDIILAERMAPEVEAVRQATQDRPLHQDEAGPSEPPRDEAGPSTPQYEVGPLHEEEEEEPRYEVGPLLEEEPAAPVQEAEDPPAAEDDDLMQIDAPADPPIPLIILSSDDEDGDGGDFGQDDEDMPEEVPDDEDDDEDPEEIPDEEEDDLEEEPFEIVPDAGDEHADEESDSDVSTLTIEIVV